MVPKDLDYQTIIMVHRKALNKLSIKRLHYNAFKLKLAKKKIYVFFMIFENKREQRMFVIQKKNT